MFNKSFWMLLLSVILMPRVFAQTETGGESILPSGTEEASEPAPVDGNHVEFELSHSSLNNGYSSWNDVNILNYFGWKGERWVIETDYKHHFDAGAAVLGVNETHVYNSLWFQDFSLAFATNNSILPGFVAFTEIHRKFLQDGSLVTGLGVGHDINESPYSDTYGLVEATYYFGGPLSVQIGTRLNDSSPGSVFAARYFGSANLQFDRYDGMVRIETGREGYTVVGQNDFENKFSSTEETIEGHYWYAARMGVGLRIDFYQSDVYNRSEIALQWLLKY